MDAIEAMLTRRSVRDFEPRAIPVSILREIVDCGRNAATALNIQPWEFVVVTDEETKRRVAEATDYGKFIANAAACIAVLCKPTKYYLEDGCAATENLLCAARAFGIGSCWVAGDKKAYADNVRALVGAPSDYRLVSLVALGYPKAWPTQEKRPIAEVIHWQRFGERDHDMA